MAKQNHPTDAELHRLLTARIDRELARQDDECDQTSIDRDTVLLCCLERGRVTPNPRHRRLALRKLTRAARQRRGRNRMQTPLRVAFALGVAVLALMSSILTVSAVAGVTPGELFRMLIRASAPKIEAQADIIIRGDFTFYRSIEAVERDGKLDFYYPYALDDGVEIIGVGFIRLPEGTRIELYFSDPKLHFSVMRHAGYCLPRSYRGGSVRHVIYGWPFYRSTKLNQATGEMETWAQFELAGDEYTIRVPQTSELFHILRWLKNPNDPDGS